MVTLTSSQVRLLLRQSLPKAQRFVVDKNYNVPTRRWLMTHYARWFDLTLRQLGSKTWTADNDCDDKARAFAWLAGVCHARTARNRQAQGIAVWEMFYIDDTIGGHAINVAIVEGVEVVFLEPQGPHQVHLSRKERESCWFVR